MGSTPNGPDGLFAKIEKEPFDTSIYKKLFLDYTYGIGKIYTEEEIEKAKKSPSFPREYQLSYNSPAGNVFSHNIINRAIELGKKYPDVINKEANHSLGVDPGFGSSSFAVVCLEYSDNIIKVVFADQYERSSFNEMVQKVWDVKNMVGS